MKRLVKMKCGAGYMTPTGVIFSPEHPFQLVEGHEAVFLLMEKDKFEEASKEDITSFYNIKQEEK